MSRLYVLSKNLAKELAFPKKLNSSTGPASAERAWASIANFYRRCREEGYPKLQKQGKDWVKCI